MSATTLRRSLTVRFVALLVALVVALTFARPAAADTDTWTDTTSHENVLVQRCADGDLVTSYTQTREYRALNRGTTRTLWEQRHVRFAGTLANAATGMSLAYAGHVTRTADLEAGTVAISGLWLRIVPPDAPMTQVWATGNNPSGIIWQSAIRPAAPIDVVASGIAGDLPDAPPAVLLEVGPSEITTRLCQILGDTPPATPGTPAEVHDCALIDPQRRGPCL
jgi:hypothetical protein